MVTRWIMALRVSIVYLFDFDVFHVCVGVSWYNDGRKGVSRYTRFI